MDNINPFVSPKSVNSLASADPDCDCWRDGKDLVLRYGGLIPSRCVFCNVVCNQSLPVVAIEYKKRWKPLLFFGLTPWKSADLGKSFQADLPICDKHYRRQLRRTGICKITNAVSALLIFPAMFIDRLGVTVVVGAIGLSIVLVIASAIFGRNPIAGRKAEHGLLLIRGVSKRFLEDLPQWVRN